MPIRLAPEQERRVEEAVRSGAYRDATDVIGQALEMLQERDKWLAAQRSEIASKIEEGYAAAARGQLVDADQVRCNLKEKKRAWLAARPEA